MNDAAILKTTNTPFDSHHSGLRSRFSKERALKQRQIAAYRGSIPANLSAPEEDASIPESFEPPSQNRAIQWAA